MILIDTREPRDLRNNLIKVLHKMGEEAEVTSLSSADFRISVKNDEGVKILGIERKEGNDLVSSIKNGRLADQMKRVADEHDYAVLLVDGYLTCTPQGKTKTAWDILDFSWAAVQGYLRTLQHMGIIVDRLPSSVWLPGYLVSVRNYYEKPGHTSFFKSRVVTLVTKVDPRLLMLSDIPGIGLQRGGDLLKKFGTLENIVGASIEELEEVKGIGKKSAEEIRRVFTE